MGQEPNIRLGFEDLPRATSKPGAPGRWAPERPGEIGTPEQARWGGAFGTPGPDTGYAIRIVRSLDLPGDDHDRSDIESVVVAVMAARASAIGRAPMAADAALAIDVLGLTDASAGEFAGIAHDHLRLGQVVAGIPIERLVG